MQIKQWLTTAVVIQNRIDGISGLIQRDMKQLVASDLTFWDQERGVVGEIF